MFKLYKTKGGNKAVNIANKKLATIPQVRSIVKRALRSNEEEKYAIVHGSYSVSTTAGVYSLSNTSQGSSGGGHIGDECRLKSIEFRWDAIVADTTNFLRVILFVWKPNMTLTGTPADTDVLKTTTPPNMITSCYEEDGEDMYRVLYDKVILLTTNGDNAIAVGKMYRKLNLKQDYTTSSSNCSNNIFLLLISDSGAVSHPTFNFTSRIAFTDA